MSNSRLRDANPAGLADHDPMDNPAFAELVRESSDRLRRLKGKPPLAPTRQEVEAAAMAEQAAPRRFG